MSPLILKQVPEIARLTKNQQSLFLTVFSGHCISVYCFRYRELAVVAFVILAEIAGIVGGAIYWHALLGGVGGGLLAIAAVLGVCFLIDAMMVARRMRRFLKTLPDRLHSNSPRNLKTNHRLHWTPGRTLR